MKSQFVFDGIYHSPCCLGGAERLRRHEIFNRRRITLKRLEHQGKLCGKCTDYIMVVLRAK